MDAYQTCDSILKVIKNSNLNFCLTESPFSVTITLKKSFIKNHDGTMRSSGISRDSCQHVKQTEVLQVQNKKFKTEINKHEEEIEDLKQSIQEHSSLLEKVKMKLNTSFTSPESNNNTLMLPSLPLTATTSPSVMKTMTNTILPLSSGNQGMSLINTTLSPVNKAKSKNMTTISKVSQTTSNTTTYSLSQTITNSSLPSLTTTLVSPNFILSPLPPPQRPRTPPGFPPILASPNFTSLPPIPPPQSPRTPPGSPPASAYTPSPCCSPSTTLSDTSQLSSVSSVFGLTADYLEMDAAEFEELKENLKNCNI